MKKIIALVLALVMVLCAVSALAESSKKSGDTDNKQQTEVTPADTADSGTQKNAGGNYYPADDGLKLEILTLNPENIQKILDKFKEAFEAGDVLAAFPEEVRALIPEDLKTINEMVGARFVGNTDKVTTDMRVNIKFLTLYDKEKDPEVAVFFGKLNGEDVVWTKYDGTVKDDGSVDVIVTKDMIQSLKNEAFVIVVVSK